MCYSLPFIGHDNHPVGPAAVGLVVVGRVEKSLLAVALLGGNGGAEKIALGVERFGGAAEKLAVAVPVVGVDVLNVEIYAVIGFLVQSGKHIFKKTVLHLLIGEHRVGDVAGKAAALAQVGDGQQGSHRIGPGSVHHGTVRDGDQLPTGGHMVAEGAEKAEIGQSLVQYALGDVGVGIAVHLDLRAAAGLHRGDQQRQLGHQTGAVIELVDAGQLFRAGAVAAGNAPQTVPRAYNVYFHWIILSLFYKYIRMKGGNCKAENNVV